MGNKAVSISYVLNRTDEWRRQGDNTERLGSFSVGFDRDARSALLSTGGGRPILRIEPSGERLNCHVLAEEPDEQRLARSLAKYFES